MKKHVDALTGIRGVAVLLVFLGHLQQRHFAYELFQGTALSAVTYFGITTFFVLSGFVIHWNYGSLFANGPAAAAYWNFFVARFSRLYPLHFAVSIIAVFIWRDYELFAQHLLMAQIWVYQGMYNTSYFNTWSISAEWFFYFAYAAAYPFMAQWIRGGSMSRLVAVAAIAYGVYWTTGPVVTETDMWLRYYAPYLRLLEFATGVVAADIVMARRDQGRRLPSDVVLVLVIAFTAVLFTTPLGRQTIINYLIAPMIAISLIVVADPRSMASRALSARWLLWIGDRSYSIYLLQALYLILAPMLALSFGYLIEPTRVFAWPSFIGGLISSTATIALVLMLSDLSWRHVEMPARNALKRTLGGGLKAAGKPTTARDSPRRL